MGQLKILTYSALIIGLSGCWYSTQSSKQKIDSKDVGTILIEKKKCAFYLNEFECLNNLSERIERV